MGLIRGDLQAFLRDLKARNSSRETLRSYEESVSQLASYVEKHRLPSDAREIKKETIESYISSIQSTRSESTAATRFRACKAFFSYLEREGELASPMGGMKEPNITEVPPPVLPDEHLKALLKTCNNDFEGRRDEAIIRVLIDSGPRRSELANVLLTDIDLDVGHIWVTGKRRRRRRVPITDATVRAIDRYLRRRNDHPQSELPYLWIGQRGRLTSSGLAQMIARRGDKAGIDVRPHLLRHVAAHRFLSKGGREGDLMQVMGWRSRSMLNRYGASLASDRAHAAFKELDLSL